MTPKRVFLAMVGVLLLTIVAVGVVYYFADQSLTARQSSISDLKADIEILDLKVANAKAAESLLDEYRDIQELAPSILPPTKIQSDIVAQLLDIGSENSIELTNFSFPTSADVSNFDTSQTEPLKGVPGVRFIEISTSFSSSFDQALNFLESVEENQRIMQVENVAMSPEVDAEGNPLSVFTVSVSISVFVRSE